MTREEGEKLFTDVDKETQMEIQRQLDLIRLRLGITREGGFDGNGLVSRVDTLEKDLENLKFSNKDALVLLEKTLSAKIEGLDNKRLTDLKRTKEVVSSIKTELATKVTKGSFTKNTEMGYKWVLMIAGIITLTVGVLSFAVGHSHIFDKPQNNAIQMNNNVVPTTQQDKTQ